MSKFEVGSLIIGNNNAPYCYTTQYALMVVLGNKSDDDYVVDIDDEDGYDSEHDLRVGIIRHNSYNSAGGVYYVNSTYFSATTYEEYMSTFPASEGCTEETLEKWEDKFDCSLSDIKAKLFATESSAENATGSTDDTKPLFTTEQLDTLTTEITTLLKKFDYRPTNNGVHTMLATWKKNKQSLIDMFEKHPNYNGKYQIVFDYDYERICDPMAINEFCNMACTSPYLKAHVLEDAVVSIFSYEECSDYYDKYQNIAYVMKCNPKYFHTVNDMSYDEVLTHKRKWDALLARYNELTTVVADRRVTMESYRRYRKIRDCFIYIRDVQQSTLSQNNAESINYYVPELKATAGQKTSRVMNKLCKLSGLDKDPDFNKKFAKYADAINPLTIKRHTILSCHPVDYLTMSFGNSWSSCHTIDKNNYRNSPHGYEGAYSGGTLSYMLDGTSMVLYTVDGSYEGNEYELQDKINRNMFHFGKDKLIQGRVYPQANDNNGGIYQIFREIVQQIMSECMENGVNAWLNVKGYYECSEVIKSHGVHYRDYENFDVCNVSYYNKEKNTAKIDVGHSSICLSCGRRHRSEKWITCSYCR